MAFRPHSAFKTRVNALVLRVVNSS